MLIIPKITNTFYVRVIECIEKEIHVPHDISLICFDDTEWGCFEDPPLTVIEPDTRSFSKAAVKLSFERINGAYSGERRHRILPTKLVERNSVKRVGKRWRN